MATKLRHTTESIQCYPVNRDKLNQLVNQTFGGTDAVIYRINGVHALVKSPKLAIIDDEFVGCGVTGEVTFYVFKTEVKVDGSECSSCLPSMEITLTLSELEEILESPISLAEFTVEQRGYNSRIRGNESDWIKYFNS